MSKPALREDIFIHEFKTIGPTEMAKIHGISLRKIFERRRNIERNLGIQLNPPPSIHNHRAIAQELYDNSAVRIHRDIVDGHVIIGGDPHYWPLPNSPLMHRAFVRFCDHFRQAKSLRLVIMNGDVLDMACISRFPRDDFSYRPTVKDEIDIGIMRMQEIEQAVGPIEKFWPGGNHDTRFSRFIAERADALEGIDGIDLKYHFPNWQICKSVEINDGFNTTTIKHSWKGGTHAVRNNVVNAGCHFITNHLHSAKVVPFTTRHHTFWGVDTGCLADIYGPQFMYVDDNPRDWRSAFCILTYRNSKLLQPELVLGFDEDHIQFRGEIIKV